MALILYNGVRADKYRKFLRDVIYDRYLYLMLLPGIIYFLIFNYLPMYGVTLAFKDYYIQKGILGSPWVGLKNFYIIFSDKNLSLIIRNTVLISIYNLIWGFPLQVIFAILLNEIRHSAFKRVVQTVTYLPHFIAWVIVAGILMNLLAIDGGLVNEIIKSLGGEPVAFLSNKKYFRTILVVTNIWKELGWSAIIYLATIANLDQHVYESAKIDGAGRFKQIIHITIPGLKSVMVIMLILSLSNILSAGFEQVLLLYNPLVYETGDIIDTYVYRSGLCEGKFSIATAVGLFKSVVSFVLIVGMNKICHLAGEEGIY